jgi:hypothetical protein
MESDLLYSKLYFENPIKHLEKNYNNIESPVSHLAPKKIYEFYAKRVPLKKIKKFLEASEGYTLLKKERQSNIHTPTLSYYPGDLIQADLFYVQKLSEENKNMKYILSAIDTYTKFAYLEAVETKSADEVLSKIALILSRMPRISNIWCFDRGGEFENSKVINFLKKRGIKTFFTLGEHKAAICEKFQSTIQRLIHTYLMQNETWEYLPYLQQICDNYNNTIHSAIYPLTPAQAENPSNSSILAEAHSKKRSLMRLKKVEPIYTKGQKVRVSLKKTKFSRGYDQSFSFEEYIISEVLTNRITPFYLLKDTKGRLLRGKFLQHQLTPVNIQTYRGRAIKHRKRGKRDEYLFEFKGYSPEFNEWLNSEQLEKI